MHLGIEIGGTKLQLAAGKGDGVIVELRRADVDRKRGAAGIREQILHEANLLAKSLNLSGPEAFLGVGVGFGGPVDSLRGLTLKSHQIEGWSNFPLTDWLRDQWGTKAIELQNDADSAGYAEAILGAGQGLDPILYMNSGSGIGGALIVNGLIYRGAGLGAMEIGHVRFGYQTLEQIASGWSIEHKVRELFHSTTILANLCPDPSKIKVQHIGEAAKLGDAVCQDAIQTATQAIGDALAFASTLLAPRRIILGGGVSLLGEDLWLAPIRNQIQNRTFPAFAQQLDVVQAQLGEEVVIQGALALAAKKVRTNGEGEIPRE